MVKEHWGTYNRTQAGQVVSALQVLLDKGLLDKKEEETARKIQRKLSYWSEGEEQTLIPFNDTEQDLLAQVEEVLWR